MKATHRKIAVWVPKTLDKALFKNQIKEIFVLLNLKYGVNFSIYRTPKEKLFFLISLFSSPGKCWIYSRNAWDAAVILFFSRLFNKKVKWWHDFRGVSHVEVSASWKRNIKRTIDRFTFCNADRVTVVTERMKTYLQQLFQSNKEVWVLPGAGININEKPRRSWQKIEAKDKVNIVFSGGHNVQYQNCPENLEKICRYLSRKYNVHLNIIRKGIVESNCTLFEEVNKFATLTFYNELEKEEYSSLLSKMDVAYVELKEDSSVPLRVSFCHPLRISDYLNYAIIITTNYRNEILEELFWYQDLNAPYLQLAKKLKEKHKVNIENPFSLDSYVDRVYKLLFE